MSKNLERLTQKQLKFREQMNQEFLNLMTNEESIRTKKQSEISQRLSSSPKIKPIFPLADLTNLELADAKVVVGELMMKAEAIGMEYRTTYMKIDQEINKRSA